MQEIRSSNSHMNTGICNPNKSRARHHRSLKLGLKLKYLKNVYISAIPMHFHLHCVNLTWQYQMYNPHSPEAKAIENILCGNVGQCVKYKLFQSMLLYICHTSAKVLSFN